MIINSHDESNSTDSKRKTPIKVATKWSDSKVSSADLASYDYSSDVPPSTTSSPAPSTSSLISTTALGTRSKAGYYEVADYLVAEKKVVASSSSSSSSATTINSSTPSIFSSLMSKLSLSPKILTSEDLAPALAAMKEHLMSKNVAKDIADKVCEGVGKNLLGTQMGGLLSSVKFEVRKALELSLVKILTPKTSTDLLLEITRKKSLIASSSISTSSSSTTTSNKSNNNNSSTFNPYCITFVGVNGVGKSTNLSKVAFWLLQNNLRVLIGACDTFRSGAVEQLRVHVKNLSKLGEEVGSNGVEGGTKKEGEGKVELFERGYGKDAAGIAKDAIAYGKSLWFLDELALSKP